MVPAPFSALEKHALIARQIFYATKTANISEERLKAVEISEAHVAHWSAMQLKTFGNDHDWKIFLTELLPVYLFC